MTTASTSNTPTIHRAIEGKSISPIQFGFGNNKDFLGKTQKPPRCRPVFRHI
jgi:hypothetical protein